MRIWHEDLIPLLCQKHLCAMWREGLGCYKILTENKTGYRNHPAVKEFESCLPALMNRLYKVRKEMLVRGYHPKELPFKYDKTWLAGVIVQNQLIKPWQTLDEQIAVLKQKGCTCKV